MRHCNIALLHQLGLYHNNVTVDNNMYVCAYMLIYHKVASPKANRKTTRNPLCSIKVESLSTSDTDQPHTYIHLTEYIVPSVSYLILDVTEDKVCEEKDVGYHSSPLHTHININFIGSM